MTCKSCAERRKMLAQASKQAASGQIIKAVQTSASVAVSAGRSAQATVARLSRLALARR